MPIISTKAYTKYTAEVAEHFRPALRFLETKLKDEQEKLENSPYVINPFSFIETREKSFDSAIQKFQKKNDGKTPNSIDELKECVRDIAGLRIICPYLDSIWDAEEIIRKLSGCRVDDNFTKNYIKAPKKSGYSGLHLTVFVEIDGKNVPVEVQIRSMLMHVWSKVEHSLRYKNENPNESTSELLTTLAKLFREIDNMLITMRDNGNELTNDDVYGMIKTMTKNIIPDNII